MKIIVEPGDEQQFGFAPGTYEYHPQRVDFTYEREYMTNRQGAQIPMRVDVFLEMRGLLRLADCEACGEKGRHTKDCPVNIAELHWPRQFNPEELPCDVLPRDIEETRRRFAAAYDVRTEKMQSSWRPLPVVDAQDDPQSGKCKQCGVRDGGHRLACIAAGPVSKYEMHNEFGLSILRPKDRNDHVVSAVIPCTECQGTGQWENPITGRRSPCSRGCRP